MVSREQIEKMLALAVQAPSGDNAQPWRFEVRGEIIDLYNIPGKDYSPYNFRERGSLFANGALIENLSIAASSLGFNAVIRLFPDAADANHIAQIAFEKADQANDALLADIPLRTTNRKPYKKTPLDPGHKAKLLAGADVSKFGELRFVEDKTRIELFAKTVSLSDQLIFEEKSIHDAIFGSIRWTPAEEQAKRGMYIKTLELPPPAQVLFKSLKNWSWLTFLNNIGISRFIASQSAATYASSSAIGMLVAPDDSNTSYVNAGRFFERLWLQATELGLSVHPVTALAYLAQRVAAGDAGELSPSHAKAITEAQNKILDAFGNPKGVVMMMFRIGYGETPSAHSRKSEANITFK